MVASLRNESSIEGLGIYRDGGVLRLRFERPDKRNALSLEIRQELAGVIEAAGRDESVRVILLSASGPHFCGGADIIAQNAGSERPRVGSLQRRLPQDAHRLIPSILEVQTPIVCQVRGYASGIGLHLALAADFTLAAEDARFWEPFAKRGFSADSGASWLLPRAFGPTLAKEMLLLGREVAGREAADLRAIHAAHPDAELDAATEALVAQLAESATVAVGLMKWCLRQSQETSLDQALANEAFALELSSRSQDFREGLAAFKEKRAPRFQGK
jgi:2-(1,2-epoxy-1,2-dihydrophenyl)acetyl-CoA isomerase